MTPDTPRRRRNEWPWPPASQAPLRDEAAFAASESRVNAAALTVARLTDDLKQALKRLEHAQAEARIVSERVAAADAARAIARARRHVC